MLYFTNFYVVFGFPKDPYISNQPSISIPQFKANGEIVESPILLDIYANSVLSLEFSVDYSDHHENDFPYISHYYDLRKTKIRLTKFKRKSPYMENCSPRMLFHGRNGDQIGGFFVHISNFTMSKDVMGLKKGCQLISLYRDLGFYEKPSKEAVNAAVENLKQLTGLMDGDNPFDTAFQFCVIIKRNTYSSIPSSNYKLLYTDMFNIIISDKKNKVHLVAAKKNDYNLNF